MRVLMVIAEMGSGGAEAVVEELATGLRAAGDEVVLASAGGRREQSLTEAGVSTRRVPLAGRSVGGVVRAQRALRAVGTATAPQVLHAHNVGATLTAHLGIRRLRRRLPLVTTFHGVAAADYGRAAAVLDRCSDHVVAVHEEVADRLRAAGLRRPGMSVIRNAVRPPVLPDPVAARTALDLPAGVGVALCAARLVPQKRHDVLLEAWAQVPGEPVLLLAGTGELGGEIADDVRRRGLQDRVRLLGERPDVPTLLAAADLFTLASDWEGLPIALLEAQAAGVPVVATDVDGVREAMGDEGARLVPRRDPAALGRALSEVLADPVARARMGEAARRRAAERTSASQMVSAYRDMYVELLAAARHPRTVAS